jgi:shikimate kinase
MNNKVVYLTGFMGSGKSTIGPVLANTLGWEYCDLDKVIEDKAGRTINEIFSLFGEEHFRGLERDALTEVARNENIIVSLGGGTIANDRNIEILKSTGMLFYLKLSPVGALDRLKFKRDRPVLLADLKEDFTNEDLLKRITDLYEKRKVYYEQSDYIIDTDNMTLGKAVDYIAKIINKERTRSNEKN